jgi:hypothetical protein
MRAELCTCRCYRSNKRRKIVIAQAARNRTTVADGSGGDTTELSGDDDDGASTALSDDDDDGASTALSDDDDDGSTTEQSADDDDTSPAIAEDGPPCLGDENGSDLSTDVASTSTPVRQVDIVVASPLHADEGSKSADAFLLTEPH